MADKKFKCVPFVTEVMTARYPRLSEPDTQGEYADGKYKTEATAGSDYTERLQDEIQRVAEANFPRKKHVHVPWRDTREGEIAFIFKSPKMRPELSDAKGNPLVAGIVIHGGSLIRLSGVIAAWEKGAKRGVSLWPDAVRVIKLADGAEAARVDDPEGIPSGAQAFGPPEDGFDGAAYAQWCNRLDCPFNRRQAP
ncbi:hypothetical protein JQ559_31300 [Bradyrhizobium viridifuturi]|jgi:hypothetical protein|nr:hypothetical protein [Bradyrhizobium viridifuturi]ERF79975.1 MAG: thioredoxin reductase (NADPH) [Bradyrhizobium sp. DFCI-1]MCA3796710.1 hypothetical protein [Burkholderia sp.]OYU61394.1 MAG: hypothetical protein CFE30_15990 [Bradyrhizobium sp. PARBB1]PSO19744.1 hypothetical protein C7G43_29970 [Bradyrhizobium sp. MOS004]QRI72281.1 hypothetical protein JQ507_12785 [Bradyrhizobium sp. PSBB068]HAQ78509.1 hypothetical protein [Bradyrhizobium sp.]